MPRIHPKPEAPGGRLLPFQAPPSDYDAVLDRVLRAFRPLFAAAERERMAARALLDELLSHPPERRQLLLRNSRRFQSLALCSVAMERSREETRSDPRQGEDLAVLALSLCDQLDPEEHGAERIEDLRVQGWMLIAKARRAAKFLAS